MTGCAAPAIAVIPARLASTRLPDKPLLARTGRPLIAHVVDTAHRARLLERVIVATDDDRIAAAATAAGAEAALTRADHPNGTSRIAEVVARLWPEATDPASHAARRIIVNLQGDEPELDPALIDRLVEALRQQPDPAATPMATIAGAFEPGEDAADPNLVKVVLDTRGRALYFSRAVIPHDREGNDRHDGGGSAPLKHAGIYAYRAGFLLDYANLPPTPLEQMEKLEQLRALEHGYHIAVITARLTHHGIDTAAQYEAFVQRYHASSPAD